MTPTFRDVVAAALADAFQIEHELTGGGMARVFVATEIALTRRVVLKFLAPESTGPLDAERFRREIQFAATLQHPNLVPLLTAGEVDGIPWYTMPFVKGDSLRDRIARGPLPFGETLRILRDVSRALAYAHREGIVHRDIKPENILLSEHGAVVADFGIAKALGASAAGGSIASSPTSTIKGIVLGTPMYMAPEQAVADAAADHRVDIYALGIVAYEMLHGAPPFTAASTTEVMLQHVHDMPVAISTLRPEVPPAVATIVMRCLEKRPDARFQSAEDLLHALESVNDATTVPASPVAPAMARPMPRLRRIALRAGVIFAALVVAAWVLLPTRTRDTLVRLAVRDWTPLDPGRIVVVPFEYQGTDSTLASLGSLGADFLTAELSAAAKVQVVNASDANIANRIATYSRFFHLSRIAAIADETGAGLVVTGRCYRDGVSLHCGTQIHNAISGDIVKTIAPVAGRAANPAALVKDVATRTMGALASVVDLTNGWINGMRDAPSLEAYVELHRGIEAFVRNDSAETFRRYARARALDTTYLEPLLIEAYNWADLGIMGRSASALDTAAALLRQVELRRARAIPAERAMADYLSSQIAGDLNGALQAVRDVRQLVAGSDLLVVYAMTADWANRPREALELLKSSDPKRGVNLIAPGFWRWKIEALHLAGDHKAELSVLDDAPRSFDSDVGLLAMRASALAALGRPADAEKIVQQVLGSAAAEPVLLADACAKVSEELTIHGDAAAGTRVAAAAMAALPAVGQQRTARARLAWGRLALDAGAAGTARVAFEGLLNAGRPGVARGALGLLALRTGDRDAAMRFAADTTSEAEPIFEADAKAMRARLSAALGERNQALRLLSAALEHGASFGSPLVTSQHLILSAPEFNALRADPAFKALADQGR